MSDGQQQGSIWTTVLIIVLMIGMLVVSRFVCGTSSGGGGCAGNEPQSQDTQINPGDLNRGTKIITPITIANDTLKVRIIPWAQLGGVADTVGFRIDQVELIVSNPNDTTKRYTMRVSDEKSERTSAKLLQATRFYDLEGKIIGTWDDQNIAEKIDSIGEFLYRSHEGFELYSKAGFMAENLEIDTSSTSSVVLIWSDSLGKEKRVRLTLQGYEINLESADSVDESAGFLFYCADGLARTEPGDNTEIGMYQLYYRDGEKNVRLISASKLQGGGGGCVGGSSTPQPPKIEPGPYEWVALRGRYFAGVILPLEPVSGKIKPHATSDRRMGMEFAADGENKFRLYFGPQDYQMLQKMGHRLPRIVELGGAAFRWLSVGMLYIFQFLYKVIPNYGVAIIIFSLLIKLIFLPLSQMQQRSMQKMQVLQPKIKEIQKRYERFGKDPEKQKQMNDEIMRLYRDHKASPFSGCLPMLIQLPVFFGLYAVLRNAIELRGAQFVKLFTVHVNNPINLLGFIKIPAGNLVWLADLSQHDPFYILPLLMGVASVFQSLRTNVDPRQRLMTLIFPIIITVVFLNFPSGLQLYWLVFNLLSLLELTIFKRGTQTGGTQWQKTKPGEIPSGMNLPKSSPK